MSLGGQGVLKRPWLWLPSRLAHDVSPYLLPLVASMSGLFNNEWCPFKWRGLTFANPLGIAGGVDKSGQSLAAWEKLGAGFLEVGTITPEAQGPNPGCILSRDIRREALWNKMGFPNTGTDSLVRHLQKVNKKHCPLFVNIGKNRWTENKDAFRDYALCVEKLHPYADVFVINLSSPNTKGLCDLLNETQLKVFLESIFQHLPHIKTRYTSRI